MVHPYDTRQPFPPLRALTGSIRFTPPFFFQWKARPVATAFLFFLFCRRISTFPPEEIRPLEGWCDEVQEMFFPPGDVFSENFFFFRRGENLDGHFFLHPRRPFFVSAQAFFCLSGQVQVVGRRFFLLRRGDPFSPSS